MAPLLSFVFLVVSIIMIFTFFLMSSRLKKIENILDVLMQLEVRKPENKRNRMCEKCGKEISVGVLQMSGILTCPNCNQIIK